MREYMREEKMIENAILEYLGYKKIKAWKANSGVIFGKDQNGKSYAHKMSPAGTSDIIGILPDGKFLGIEVKRQGHDASLLQQAFIDEINKSMGYAFTAHSVDEVKDFLKRFDY